MRVLQVISGIEPENGGPTAVILGMTRALRVAGIEADVVASWRSRSAFDTAKVIEESGASVTLVGPGRTPLLWHPVLGRTLMGLVRQYDVVHIHALWEQIQVDAARASVAHGKPYVWTPHGMLDRWSLSQHSLRKKVLLAARVNRWLRGATCIHAASEFERRQLQDSREGAQIEQQGFGVDQSLLGDLPSRGEWRRARSISDVTPLILFLGRIQRGKGLEYLVPAMSRIEDRSAVLVVAGPDAGGYKSEIIRLVDEHRVNARVLFVGMVRGHEKVSLLQDADVLAAVSEHENFGIAAAEALAVGTPVLASDQVGLRDPLFDHRSLVECGVSVTSCAGALDLMLRQRSASADDRDQLRAAARQLFDWRRVAEGFGRLYEAAIERHAGRR